MAFVLRVREWQDDFLSQYPEKPEVAWIIGELFTKMAQGWRVRFYTEYLPDWDLDAHPPNRGLASEALGYIWRRCQREFLPELNYLVVSKRTKLPGKFMRGAWEEKYGSRRGFEAFCKTRMHEATRMLDYGSVTFDLRDVIQTPRAPNTALGVPC